MAVRRRFGFGLKSPKSCTLLSAEAYSSLLFESSRSPLLSLKKALPPLFWVVLFDATPDACLLQANPDPVLLFGVLPVSSGAALPAM